MKASSSRLWLTSIPKTTVLASLLIGAASISPARGEIKKLDVGGFAVEHQVVVPGSTEAAFDAFTGDIKPWWDHHFSENPRKLFIEPKPGGGFYEIFDDDGNGVLHATVNFAQRGKLLRFTGPLGLSGNALTLVTSVEFAADEEGGTRVKVTCHAAGQMEEGWAEAVDGVWNHFLVEQYKSHVESLHAESDAAITKPGRADEKTPQVIHATMNGASTGRAPAGSTSTGEVSMAEVRAAVKKAWRDHIDAARRKSLEEVMEIYADDIVYAVSGAQEVRGRAALAGMEAQTLETADVLDAAHTIESLSVFGDVAYEIGTVAGQIRHEGQAAVTVTFHFMARWHRQSDGAWRIQYMVGAPE